MSAIDGETGFKDPAGEGAGGLGFGTATAEAGTRNESPSFSETSPLPAGPLTLDARQATAAARILHLVKGAVEGTLPLERELHAWEPQKLNASHVSMCIDRALGYTPSEIAAKYGYAAKYVSVLLLHPYSQLLISTMLAAAADRVQDINVRLEALAPEALNVKVDLLRTSKSEKLRNDIADSILDRAGYGSRKKIEISQKHTLNVPAALATSLEKVLEESNRVAVVDYSRFVSSPSVESNSTSSDSALQQSAGHTLPVVTPPVAEPVAEETAEERSVREERDWAKESRLQRIA